MCKETGSAFKVLILWPPLARASIACASQRGAESIFRLQPKKRQLRVNSLILHFFGFLHQILRSADPRFGPQPTTASFCNADDDLIPRADLWIHGHLHCRHDYLVARPGLHASRVVCQARGLEKKGEAEGYDPLRLIEV